MRSGFQENAGPARKVIHCINPVCGNLYVNLLKEYISVYYFFPYVNGCNRLEHGVYNLSRIRESATKRYRGFQIPVDWMLETGIVSQVVIYFVILIQLELG